MRNATATPSPALLEIDLWPYARALVGAWKGIAGFAVLAAVLTAFWAASRPYLYESTARVSIVDIEDPGGVSPDDRRAPEVLTLVEHGFVMGTTRDNYNDVMLARLRSRHFVMRFIDEHNVYRHFHPEQWLASEQRWRQGFEPDRGGVFTRFRDEVLTVDRDEETDIITVSMIWPDPKVARDWANAYVAGFNAYIRERTMEEVRGKQAYLEQELRESDILEIRQSIYRLIEAQTAIAMLASAREEYALEVIDPAALPYRSFTLSRKKRVVVGAFVGFLLGAFIVLASVLARQALNQVRQGLAAATPQS